MDTQVESAVELAFSPTTEQNLKGQAYEFLNVLKQDPNAWQVCLTLFTRQPAPSEVVRLVCLEIVNNAVQTQRLEQAGLNDVRYRLMEYVRRRYSPGSTEADTPTIQNKVTQTLTYLFTSLYASDWTNFFDEFISLATSGQAIGSDGAYAGTVLLLRILGSIHDEIADVMIPRTQEEQRRSTELKDLVRARDVNKIATVWQEVLSRWQQLELGIVEMCLRTIAKWVSWIDIWLVINERIQGALLEIAGRQGTFSSDSREAKARDAAIDTFTETVGKKMQPNDKIELINYLNLVTIVGQLVASPALAELRTTSDYDTDLAETVAKLVNNVIFDVVKVLDNDNVEAQTRTKAEEQLQAFVPYLLRFFADEYDEICSAVIPSLTDLLTMFRRLTKAKGGLPTHYTGMLQPILDAIIAKMKYDDTASWGDEDEQTDEAEFQELRKRLHVLQQTVAAVDEGMYMDTLTRVVANTLGRLGGDDRPNWRDLDLALLEMHHFGELAIRNGGLYSKSKPASEASSRLVEMMSTLVASDLANYPHPAVQLQYMEICVRYVQFFEQNVAGIPKVLENFVTFVHSDHSKVRLRSWYLFQRFVKHLRAQLGDFAQTIVQAVSDLLIIKAELPTDRDEDDDSSGDGITTDAAFQNQQYLFEAIGQVSSTQNVATPTKVAIAKSVIDPLSQDLNNHLPAARNGDERSILQVHHIIMALGSLANGYSDWTPGAAASAAPPAELAQEFELAGESVLLALENLKHNSELRAAARHAFSRFLGVLGSRVLPQLPRWIEGLLSSASTNDEMAMFLRTLGQVVYGFKTEIFAILDQLLSPLLQRVFSGFSQDVTGTDDEIQLRELRREYLNFVLVILNHDLGPVLVSPANQGIFDSFVTSITRFSCDISDPQSARLAFSVLTKITSIWGGPDIVDLKNNDAVAQPTLPGFDTFILSHFAPLPWALVSSQGFNAQDAQMRSVLQEAGTLQWTILRKNGVAYQAQLQNELQNLGVGDQGIESYLGSIAGEMLTFRKFFSSFVAQAKR
ncbi:putative armadillo-like helical, exportin-1/Importin-beta, exportin-T [Septoria linicola]|nr:putative armadillo-like helical, exportin-1/Importin-beta, exportin-T [Septoria linicola]